MIHERRNKIIEMLVANPTVSNDELMKRFGISIETVRRDLAYLEKRGVLERVYGGAVRKNYINSEPSYKGREKTGRAEKEAIAEAAQSLISKNDTVFFDLGTTVGMIAEKIDKNKNITAFTNSLRTAITLSERGFKVFLPGGFLRAGELSVSGSIAESNMNMFNIDKAFIGAGGITENGITDFIETEAYLRTQVIKNADKVIAVADHTKFEIKAMCRICSAEDINILITDAVSPKKTLKDLEKRGIEIITVKQTM